MGEPFIIHYMPKKYICPQWFSCRVIGYRTCNHGQRHTHTDYCDFVYGQQWPLGHSGRDPYHHCLGESDGPTKTMKCQEIEE
jgi:hypothetical protein